MTELPEGAIPATLDPEEADRSQTLERRHNRQLLLEAQKLSGLSERRFAKEILGRDERTFRSWKEGAPISEAAMGLIRRVHESNLKRSIRKAKQGSDGKEAQARAEEKRARKRLKRKRLAGKR